MSDLEKYIEKRKKQDKEFEKDFEVGYQHFKIGVVLRMLRENAGLTQEELAKRLKTKKSVISRIENHAEDIRLSTLNKYVETFGRKLKIKFVSK